MSNNKHAKRMSDNQAGMIINQLDSLHTTLSRMEMQERMTFANGQRIDKECGYPTNITPQMYKEMFDRDGIPNRLVRLLPEEAFKHDPDVYDDEDPATTTPFEQAIEYLEREHKLWHYVEKFVIASRIGRFGLLLIGINDGKELKEPADLSKGVYDPKKLLTTDPKKDSSNPSGSNNPTDKQEGKEDPNKNQEGNHYPSDEKQQTPPNQNNEDDNLNPTETDDNDSPSAKIAEGGQVELLYLRPYEEVYVKVIETDRDPRSRRFGHPTMYRITYSIAEKDTQVNETFEVHWTRVIHSSEGGLSSDIYGAPVLQKDFNRLYDLKKILGGGAEMFYKGGFGGLSIESQDGLQGNVKIDEDSVTTQIHAYMSSLRKYILSKGLRVNQLQPNIADPRGHYEIVIKSISISQNVPYRILTGTEQGQLAGSQDGDQWNKQVMRFEGKHIIPNAIRPLIDRLIQMGVCPVPTPKLKGEEGTLPQGGYFVEFPDLTTPNELEKAQIAEVITRSLISYANGNGHTVIAPMEFLTLVMGFTKAEAETIIQNAEQALQEMEEKYGFDPTDDLNNEDDDEDNPDNEDDDEEGGDANNDPNNKNNNNGSKKGNDKDPKKKFPFQK